MSQNEYISDNIVASEVDGLRQWAYYLINESLKLLQEKFPYSQENESFKNDRLRSYTKHFYKQFIYLLSFELNTSEDCVTLWELAHQFQDKLLEFDLNAVLFDQHRED